MSTPRTEDRIESLRAWVAELDRKLGVRSYAGGAALVLALAAGIVGVVLALSAKDESATKEEVRELRGEVAGVGEQATATAEERVQELSDRLETLEGQVADLQASGRSTESELDVVQDDIEDLRSEVSGLDAAGDPGAEPPGGP